MIPVKYCITGNLVNNNFDFIQYVTLFSCYFTNSIRYLFTGIDIMAPYFVPVPNFGIRAGNYWRSSRGGRRPAPFICPNNCGRNYLSKSSLTRHLKYECGRAKQFICEFCEKPFSHKADMKIHVGVVHSKILT